MLLGGRRMERRLAAVLFADVVGYGRHSQRDEEGTRALFQADLHGLFEPRIAAHHGRLVKTIGDAVLAEFQSVVDAVRCAIEIQRAKASCVPQGPADHILVYRISINLGDVIVEGDDIHGDGVNIGERLQTVAEPGGVVISGTTYDHVEQKLDIGFEYLGEKKLKNVDKPVRVYSLLIDTARSRRAVWRNGASGLRMRSAMALGILLAIAAGAAAWWQPWAPRIEAASLSHMALPLPDKPSVAVLPFANMSDEPGQEHLSDGITDDLITALSQVSGLFIISRNSTFVFKGKNVPPRQVSEELGVRYVLEGSVQRAGDRLRINAQLIDALEGGHVWADRYDGSLTDVFALQDRVARSITDALSVRLTDAEKQALRQQETAVPEAYEEFLRGWLHIRRDTPEDYRQGISHLETAAKLDPKYGRAHAALAWAYLEAYRRTWAFGLGLSQSQARQAAWRHLAEARKHPTTLYLQAEGFLSWVDGALSDALAQLKEAIAADPGDALSYVYMGAALIALGRPAEAVQFIRTAMRLEPRYPAAFAYFLGLGQFDLEQYSQAAESFENATRLNPEDETSFAALAAAYGILDRKAEAELAVARCDELRVKRGGAPITTLTMPWFAIGSPSGALHIVGSGRIHQGLSAAGVPVYLSRGAFRDRNKLSANEIRAQIVGHRLHGRSIFTGQERAASVSTSGIAEISGDWVSSGPHSGGSVQIEDDELCYKFGLLSYCGIVLRNPGGTRELENEFIWDAGSPFTFSPVK